MGNTILELNTFKDLMEVKLSSKFLKTCQYINYSGSKCLTSYFSTQVRKKWNGLKLQEEKCKSWLEVWNTWIHRRTINQNLPLKQICKRNYKNSGKFQRNFGQVTGRSSYISKLRRKHFVKISGCIAVPLIWTTPGEGKLLILKTQILLLKAANMQSVKNNQ